MPKSSLDILIAIATVATPLIVLLLSGIGWRLKRQIDRRLDRESRQAERLLELEDKLRDDRIATYNGILQPFIPLLMSDTHWMADPKNRTKDRNDLARRQLLSLEYRQLGFKLALIGSDAVVVAYNNLMQFFFTRSSENELASDHVDMLFLLGTFLLEIRRSMGNEATTIDGWQMLEWFVTDARRYRARTIDQPRTP